MYHDHVQMTDHLCHLHDHVHCCQRQQCTMIMYIVDTKTIYMIMYICLQIIFVT